MTPIADLLFDIVGIGMIVAATVMFVRERIVPGSFEHKLVLGCMAISLTGGLIWIVEKLT